MEATNHETGAQKKAAYFLDGASLNLMKDTMGLRMIDFPQLRIVLCKKIGRGIPLIEDPVITVGSAHINGLGRALTRAGFNPVCADSFQKEDDRVLMERISAVKSTEVSRIIIVTSDGEFLPHALKKVKEGIRVIWVSVMSLRDRDGSFGLGTQVRSHFGRELIGVALETYAKELSCADEGRASSTYSRSQLLRRY